MQSCVPLAAELPYRRPRELAAVPPHLVHAVLGAEGHVGHVAGVVVLEAHALEQLGARGVGGDGLVGEEEEGHLGYCFVRGGRLPKFVSQCPPRAAAAAAAAAATRQKI